MDTVDKRKTNEWLENLDRELNGRTPDYLVISHIEPDHASNIKVVSEKYPSMKLVGNAKTFSMLPQFFRILILPIKPLQSKRVTNLNSVRTSLHS